MFFRHRRQAEVTIRHATKRALCAALLSALGATQASAQTPVSQRLLELDDDERNTSFTLMLMDSGRRCDEVVRTLFKGTVLGVDEWEALCKDRNAYSISVLTEQDETIITSLSCRELSATSKMLLERSGRQQEQGRRLQDQVARDGPRDEPNRTCHSAYQSGARLCDWHVFRLVEPGSAAEIASALVRSFEHRARLCAQRYRQGSSEPFRPLGKKSFANR